MTVYWIWRETVTFIVLTLSFRDVWMRPHQSILLSSRCMNKLLFRINDAQTGGLFVLLCSPPYFLLVWFIYCVVFPCLLSLFPPCINYPDSFLVLSLKLDHHLPSQFLYPPFSSLFVSQFHLRCMVSRSVSIFTISYSAFSPTFQMSSSHFQFPLHLTNSLQLWTSILFIRKESRLMDLCYICNSLFAHKHHRTYIASGCMRKGDREDKIGKGNR